jgi:hypothetical protein
MPSENPVFDDGAFYHGACMERRAFGSDPIPAVAIPLPKCTYWAHHRRRSVPSELLAGAGFSRSDSGVALAQSTRIAVRRNTRWRLGNRSRARALSVGATIRDRENCSGLHDPTARAIVFDCDGVLVDSERLAVRIDVKVITALGWAMTEAEIIDRFVGRSEESIAKDIEAHLGRPLPPNWTADNEHLYRAAFAAELKPVPRVIEALDQITLPRCVASSAPL